MTRFCGCVPSQINREVWGIYRHIKSVPIERSGEQEE